AAPRGAAVVEDDAVREEQLAGAGRLELQTVCRERAGELEIADHAVLDVQGRQLLRNDTDAAAEAAVEHQPAQADDVATGGIDENAGCRRDDSSLARAVVGDADRLADDDRTIIAGTQHGDLAAGGDNVVGVLEGRAWLCGSAGIGVAAIPGDPDL